MQVSCGGKSFNFTAWMATGLDRGTTVQALPSTPEIMGWATALLGITGA